MTKVCNAMAPERDEAGAVSPTPKGGEGMPTWVGH